MTVHHDLPWLAAQVRDLSDHHGAGHPEPWSVDDAPDGFVAGPRPRRPSRHEIDLPRAVHHATESGDDASVVER